ncbi:hypothetical protein [Ramlibacter alkalitolerans]|uniref:Uncharacterized protein n=1 Tax=Ramlibacter alkalitolerans TaxID=2039631 RepID=A0ABS1JID0_9BURK|nr:hypothetical protein [Ramlibacter alkalitolerans]MBL0423987.1 hypothetical protein [Ramlibacter alkalitolerans]
MKPSRPTSSEVARWIAGHFAAHPRAADTAQGIRRWWLVPRHGEVELECVQQALAELEKEGVVSSHSIGGQVVWRLAAQAGQGDGSGGEA